MGSQEEREREREEEVKRGSVITDEVTN